MVWKWVAYKMWHISNRLMLSSQICNENLKLMKLGNWLLRKFDDAASHPWLGRSVPGARGAQHTTNMAAALSKLPLRTISTILIFPWLLPVQALKIGRFGSNSSENTHSVEIWCWKKGKWRNVSGGLTVRILLNSHVALESTEVSDQVEYFR